MSLRDEIRRRVKKAAEKQAKQLSTNIKEARLYLERMLQAEVSVPVPIPYAPATLGAPPRRKSGNLKRRISVRYLGDGVFQIGSNATSPGGFPYPMYHEIRYPTKIRSGRHPWIRPVVERERLRVEAILNRGLGNQSRIKLRVIYMPFIL